jgi:alpha-ketoglutarate-dependent taurine dioxygenase
VLDIPADTRVASAEVSQEGDLRLRFDPGGKEAHYPAGFLAERVHDGVEPRPRGWTGPEIERWDSSLRHRLPTSSYGQVVSDRTALGRWLAAVRRFGFAVLTGVPARPGALCEVAELFGHVRETNYGRWFEVRAEVNPSNLAYTNLGLQAHTDNPYRDPVPTLQLLACLENTVEGGDSVVVDGFKAAEVLQGEMPEGFDLLTRRCARFEYAVPKACA